MVYIGECSACQMGDHQRHERNYAPVSAGVMGGAICLCEGECEKKTPEDIAQGLGLPARFFEILRRKRR